MAVYYDLIITGWPSKVESRLRKKIAALARHHARHQKIGITNNPNIRWKQGYFNSGWHEMRVLYKSSRHFHVRQLEQNLVEYFKGGLSAVQCVYYNKINGGGGRTPNNPPYYLYVVNAARYARIKP